MKKIFKSYLIIWLILLVLFNVISFVSVGWTGIEKYTPSFWIGYIFITVAFFGQIICAYFALKDDDIQKSFYNISLITTSYAGLIFSFIIGGLCMLISTLPYWVGVILCAIVLALNAIAVVEASAAIDLVNDIDGKIKENTLFIKSLTVDAESLMSSAKSQDIKAACQKVYEAIRYSDPVSSDALSSIEGEIAIEFDKLSEAVAKDDLDTICILADEIITLINKRNANCRILK